jgi:glutathione S-transferase
MLKFYFHSTPNPMKVALPLEELQLPFELIGVDIFKGEQHSPQYRRINPNGKVPTVVDDGIAIFDSHAILLHLAAEHRKFIPNQRAERVALSVRNMLITRAKTLTHSSHIKSADQGLQPCQGASLEDGIAGVKLLTKKKASSAVEGLTRQSAETFARNDRGVESHARTSSFRRPCRTSRNINGRPASVRVRSMLSSCIGLEGSPPEAVALLIAMMYRSSPYTRRRNKPIMGGLLRASAQRGPSSFQLMT